MQILTHKGADRISEQRLCEFVDRRDNSLLGYSTVIYFSNLLRNAMSSEILRDGDMYLKGITAVDIPNLELVYMGGEVEDTIDMLINVDIVPCIVADVPASWSNPPNCRC